MDDSETPARPLGRRRVFTTCHALWSFRRVTIAILTPLVLLAVPVTHPTKPGFCAYIILMMSVFWVTEVIPMAATALIPMVLMPGFGIERSSDLANLYITDTSMVIIGGMLVAVSVEKWNLHKRCALRVLMLVGSHPKWLMFGFIMVTGFLSMWISNTATAAMLIPILEAVLVELEKQSDTETDYNDYTGDRDLNNGEILLTSYPDESRDSFDAQSHDLSIAVKPRAEGVRGNSFSNMSQALTLCIAYGANIGGIATLTGTAPNLVLKGLLDRLYSPENPISYGSWIVFASPISVICLVLAWLWLVCYFLGWRELCFWCNKSKEPEDNTAARVIRSEYIKLGPISFAEITVLVHFILLVLLWMARDPGFVQGWGSLFHQGYVSDGCAAILIALSLFILPSRRPSLACFTGLSGRGTVQKASVPLLDWESVHRGLPWGVMVLFGGGFAVAHGCQVSGLSVVIGDALRPLEGVPVSLLALLLALLTMTMTEFTNNTATVAILLPIISNMADSIHVNPLRLMLPCTVATSFTFTLPVANLPSAIVFAYGRLNVLNMVKAGVPMNILCVPVLLLAIHTWGTAIFDLDTYPDWALKVNQTDAIMALNGTNQ